jgi:hypothetical protein
MADQAIQLNFIPLSSIWYYLSDSLLRFPFPPAHLQKPMAGSGNRRRASDEAEGSRAGSRQRW